MNPLLLCLILMLAPTTAAIPQSHTLIALTPYHGLPGTFVLMTGSGFDPVPENCWSNVTFTPQPFEMPASATQGICIIDSSGLLAGNFTVRPNTTPGLYSLRMQVNGTVLATFTVDATTTTTTTTMSSGATLRNPWDNQTVAIHMDRGTYLPNDTVHYTIDVAGNFSNTLWIYSTVENESGSVIWESYWQPNPTLANQSVAVDWTIPAAIPCGYYTLYVRWDHRQASLDFWINAACMPIPEFGADILIVLSACCASITALNRSRKWSRHS